MFWMIGAITFHAFNQWVSTTLTRYVCLCFLYVTVVSSSSNTIHTTSNYRGLRTGSTYLLLYITHTYLVSTISNTTPQCVNTSILFEFRNSTISPCTCTKADSTKPSARTCRGKYICDQDASPMFQGFISGLTLGKR